MPPSDQDHRKIAARPLRGARRRRWFGGPDEPLGIVRRAEAVLRDLLVWGWPLMVAPAEITDTDAQRPAQPEPPVEQVLILRVGLDTPGPACRTPIDAVPECNDEVDRRHRAIFVKIADSVLMDANILFTRREPAQYRRDPPS